MDKANQVRSLFQMWDADSAIEPKRQCGDCKWKWPGSGKCWAFPDGIPEQFLTAEKRHDVPRPDLGQNNQIVFEKSQPGEKPLTMEE